MFDKRKAKRQSSRHRRYLEGFKKFDFSPRYFRSGILRRTEVLGEAEHKLNLFLTLMLHTSNRLRGFINCPFRTREEDVLCPLSCNSQKTLAPNLWPLRWSKVQ